MRLFALILLLSSLSPLAVAQQGTVTSKEGKYGIFDKNHGVILPPVCDTIISKTSWNNWNGMFFILKKEDKYAYAYFRNLDSLGYFGYLNPHWEISEFVYDELKLIFSLKTLEFVTYLTLQYKKNGKYGIIYIRTHSDCNTGIWTICRIGGFGELNKTEAVYDEPLSYNDDKILHVKSDGKYGLLEFADAKDKWLNYTYNEWFDTIPLLIEKGREYEPLLRMVKKNGKWGLIKINTEKKEIEYLIPSINNSNKEIAYTYLFEVFYTKKAVNDTVYINDTENNLRLKLNIPTNGDLEVYVDVLKFNSTYNTNEKENKKSYLMLGLNNRSEPFYIYKEITLFDEKGNIIAINNDPNAKYMLHKNKWGALISKTTINGKQSIHEFYDVETGEKIFTLKTATNTIISSCELDIPKIPLAVIENGKKDKMCGYYDFTTKKYNKNNPNKDERCNGF